MFEFGVKKSGIDYIIRPSVYGVLIYNGQLGVIYSKVYGKYFLVGGGCHQAENENETLYREAFEEIWFEIEIGEKIGEATEYLFTKIENTYFAKLCKFYRIYLQDKINLKAEMNLVWIGNIQIIEMYHKSHQWIIEQEVKKEFF